MTPAVTVSQRGEERIRGGHPWVYRSDIVAVDRADAGAVVRVVTGRGGRHRPLGSALYSDRSEIAIRLITRADEAIDEGFWRRRIEQAIAYRASLEIEATGTDAYRLVHGEGDLLPSLVVDRYREYLVVQALSQGTDRLQPTFVKHLVDLLQPRGILARNDPRVRQLEGLEQKVELLHGEVPERLTVREAGVEYEIDPWRAQKTGLFLDQRENRIAARRWAHGRLLDCFSYHGGFALALAPRCDAALALDISEAAVKQIEANAARNGLTNLEAREANVFDELRELDRAGERFDTIVLDPPAFAKSKSAIPKAAAGYKEINLRAMKLLAPGGILVTCSCSYNVDEEMFGAIVQQAAADAHASLVLVEKRLQGRDHPVLVGVPETYYLKCLILRKIA
ncbi:MAG TPA: class I SAM-dependent rRNA methyltransferase [Vicinamibacterales bacterium]|nr:class I SAM-dependent rRNA methyltransferase [Vicinamibacterales bacterium]